MQPAPHAEVPRSTAVELVSEYLLRWNDHDPDALIGYWAPGGVDQLSRDEHVVAPDELRAYYAGLFGAFPDFRLALLECVPAEGGCIARWRATGTFLGPGRFQGFLPTGRAVAFDGVDCFTVDGDLIAGNVAVVDGLAIARSLGVLPPAGAAADRISKLLVNAATRLRR